jgi:hypothetical protein
MAQQTASEANTRLQTVEQVITNFDEYKPVTQVEIRFRPGQAKLSARAKEALDDMATQLRDQKGYVVEVQGFAPGRGTSSIESSSRMAEAVARYLVLNHEVPVYRVHVIGVGNIPTETAEGKRVRGSRVEVSLLKNDLEQLSAAQPIQVPEAGQPAQGQGGMSGTATSGTATTTTQPETTTNPSAPPQEQEQKPQPPPQQ